jgi:hypothetical protein
MYVNVIMIPVETGSGINEGMKERRGEGEFKYDIYDTL